MPATADIIQQRIAACEARGLKASAEYPPRYSRSGDPDEYPFVWVDSGFCGSVAHDAGFDTPDLPSFTAWLDTHFGKPSEALTPSGGPLLEYVPCGGGGGGGSFQPPSPQPSPDALAIVAAIEAALPLDWRVVRDGYYYIGERWNRETLAWDDATEGFTDRADALAALLKELPKGKSV